MKPNNIIKTQPVYGGTKYKKVKEEEEPSSSKDDVDNPDALTNWREIDIALHTNAIVTPLPEDFKGCTIGDKLLIKKIGVKMGSGKNRGRPT